MSSAHATFIDLVAEWDNQLQSRRVTEFHYDLGKEFDAGALDSWANTHGVTQRLALAYNAMVWQSVKTWR
jgi:hypothetical protein